LENALKNGKKEKEKDFSSLSIFGPAQPEPSNERRFGLDPACGPLLLPRFPLGPSPASDLTRARRLPSLSVADTAGPLVRDAFFLPTPARISFFAFTD
jgi:hypothetical protein